MLRGDPTVGGKSRIKGDEAVWGGGVGLVGKVTPEQSPDFEAENHVDV